MNKCVVAIIFASLTFLSGLCLQGCSRTAENQEIQRAQDEIMVSISQAMNATPVSFSDRKEPTDYFRPECTSEGIVLDKVIDVEIKETHIEGETGKMRIRVVFESYPPLEKSDTYLFNVNLRIKSEDGVWHIVAVNPEQ